MNKTVVCSVCHLYDVNVLGDTVLMMSNFFFSLQKWEANCR
jgi:hypothetical protein